MTRTRLTAEERREKARLRSLRWRRAHGIGPRRQVAMQTSSLRLLRRVTIAVSIAFGIAAPTPTMADLITLSIPGIKGDVTVTGQEGTVEVLSISNP